MSISIKPSMESVLCDYLKEYVGFAPEYVSYDYKESVNPDVISNQWLEKGSSFIWKVGVVTFIDANKCDWVHLAVAIQRDLESPVVVIGQLTFPEGENDDIGRVLSRMMDCLSWIDPIFLNK